jgi:ATP-binding cassette subfamily A (ABC1) protein 3
MEEADALADRVGVLAKHMLDVGTTQHLRDKHGYGFHIHLILKSAPRSADEEMNNVQDWVERHFPGAQIERQAYHGQLRYESLHTLSLLQADTVSIDSTSPPPPTNNNLP